MRRLLTFYIALVSLTSTASAEVAKVTESLYAGIGDNGILLILITQLLQFIWVMSKWIFDTYIKKQEDKDAEVKNLKEEFHQLRSEIIGEFKEIKNEMRHIQKMPSEGEIMNRLEERMEFMVYKATRGLGIKGNQ